MNKVSFDWDSTLDSEPKQKFAEELMNRGFEVWIVTSRYDDEHLAEKFGMKPQYAKLGNKDIFEKARDLNIPKERIVFTNMSDKHTFLEDKNFIFHLDDDWVENDLINKHTNCVGISAISPNWKNKCERTLEKYINKTS